MGFSDAARVKTAALPAPPGNLPSSFGRFPLLRPERTPAPRSGSTAGGAADSGKRLIMKIMIFCINSYKFTGFLDKFLKTDGAGTKITILFISVFYNRIINRKSNFFQEFIEIKRFFATPHFPATARICAPERGRRHRPGRDAPAGPAAEIPPASGGGFFVSPATWYIRGTPPPHWETRRAWRRIPRISRKYP